MIVEKLEGKALAATVVPEGCSMVMFDGAVRSSKTLSSLLMWVRYIRTGPKGALLMMGRTETAVINNLILPLQEMLGKKRVKLNRGTGTATIMGREVTLLGAPNIEARTKIQGMTLAGAYVDEGANIPEDVFNMLRSRLSVPGAMLFLTCNPEGAKHWLHVKWLMRARVWIDAKGVRRFNEAADALEIFRVTFLLDDNLWLKRNNPKFFHELHNTWAVGSTFYKRYILSQWVSAEGAVYDIWDEARMTLSLAELPPVESVLMSGLDYGTNHRTRAYLLGLVRVDFIDGKPDWMGTKLRGGVNPATQRPVLVILAEFAPPTGTVGEHATLYQNWLHAHRHWGEPEWLAIDPAAAVFKGELFARDVTNVMNAHNSVVSGIQTVASLLATAALFIIRESCPELVAGIPRYMWDKKASERGETKVVKVEDDEVDALRYTVYTARRYWRDQIALAPISDVDTEPEDGTE